MKKIDSQGHFEGRFHDNRAILRYDALSAPRFLFIN